MQYALVTFGHSLIIVIFSGKIAFYHTRYERLQKLFFGEPKLLSYVYQFLDSSSSN